MANTVNTREIRQFRRALRTFERINNLQLKHCCSGVTLAQCLVLLEIEETARQTLGQLASRLRLDNSTLSRTVDGLVQKRLVERLQDDKDRRAIRLQLTSKGEAVCRSIHSDNDAYCRRVFGRIPSSQRRTVIRHFEILVQAYLDNEAASAGGSP
jgi:DNA-binding MarR family transcriptional regulator